MTPPVSKTDGAARHVAIIMDGNGRWAKQRHLPRAMGHRKGVEAVRSLVRGLAGLGLDCLTLYAFSSENWKRPEDEVSDLMDLMRRFIKSDLPEFIENNVRLQHHRRLARAGPRYRDNAGRCAGADAAWHADACRGAELRGAA